MYVCVFLFSIGLLRRPSVATNFVLSSVLVKLSNILKEEYPCFSSETNGFWK